MGFPMARNLLQAGFDVTAWNRDTRKSTALKDFGGQVAISPAEAAQDAQCVITMLSDGQAVNDVLFSLGLATSMRSGTLFIDMSSIKPAEARANAKDLATRGIEALDAPVSGGTKGADMASLAIMAGGTVAAFERAVPAFKAMGRPTYVGAAGTGQIAKLANQGIVAIDRKSVV